MDSHSIVDFSPIRVFLVDDSPLALVLLKRMIATSPDLEIVGTARNGEEALRLFPAARPKVICTDYQMPVMDGLALIRATMDVYPRPILVVSSFIDSKEREQALPLLAAGAVDIFAKPSAADPFDYTARRLVRKIKMLAGVFVSSRRDSQNAVPQAGATASSPALRREQATKSTPSGALNSSLVRLVAIGASTGGPQVLQTILAALPANFPVPILCVQHISAGFLDGLVEWLNNSCALCVTIARKGEKALPGNVYFPPEGEHLEINASGYLVPTSAPPVDGHRPSVTVTFESVGQRLGSSVLAVLLTGMGGDGARGLHSILQAGGQTIAQSEESCVVFGMPKQAIALGAAQMILAPDEIIQILLRVASQRGAV